MRRKGTGYRVQGTVIFLIFLFLLITPVYAQEASKSASPSGSLLQKLNELKAQIASKASEIQKQVVSRVSNKAYAGLIKTIDGENITLVTKSDEKTILVNEYTIYSIAKVKNPALDDLVNKDFIIALGDMDDRGNLVAKKVIKSQKQTLEKKAYFGIVEEILGNSIIVKTKDDKEITVQTSLSTDYILKKEEASLKDVKETKAIAVIGIPNGESRVRASLVYILPQVGTFKNEKGKNSSSSATPSSTKR